jgi:hypothetical protein
MKDRLQLSVLQPLEQTLKPHCTKDTLEIKHSNLKVLVGAPGSTLGIEELLQLVELLAKCFHRRASPKGKSEILNLQFLRERAAEKIYPRLLIICPAPYNLMPPASCILVSRGGVRDLHTANCLLPPGGSIAMMIKTPKV